MSRIHATHRTIHKTIAAMQSAHTRCFLSNPSLRMHPKHSEKKNIKFYIPQCNLASRNRGNHRRHGVKSIETQRHYACKPLQSWHQVGQFGGHNWSEDRHLQLAVLGHCNASPAENTTMQRLSRLNPYSMYNFRSTCTYTEFCSIQSWSGFGRAATSSRQTLEPMTKRMPCSQTVCTKALVALLP